MANYDDFFTYVKPDVHTQYTPIDTSNIVKNTENRYGVDMHIHSNFSTDGYMTFEQIVKRCQENGVLYASVTDHNSFQAIKEMRQSNSAKKHRTYFDYDGVKVFTGVEVSCHMKLNSHNFIKLHMLCYGFDVDNENIVTQMIGAKDKDYTFVRYYPLYYLAKIDPIYKTSLAEYKDFQADRTDKFNFTGRIGRNDAIMFYTSKGIDYKKVSRDLSGLNIKEDAVDTITLDVVDVINATHASGGLCSIAHPVVNTERHRLLFHPDFDPLKYASKITNKLLQVGCDGIELSNKGNLVSRQFNNAFAQTFMRSCGTDTHYYGEHSHSDIGKYKTTDVMNQNIVEVLQNLESAKVLGTTTDRQKQIAEISDQNTFVSFKNKHKKRNQMKYEEKMKQKNAIGNYKTNEDGRKA